MFVPSAALHTHTPAHQLSLAAGNKPPTHLKLRVEVMSWNSSAFIKFILNYWSIPAFSHFSSPLLWKGRKSKNSRWASVPRSLSMFSQSGSVSEFRWASCSSHSRRVSSHAASHIRTDVHTRARPIHLKHVPAITLSHTHKELFALEFERCVSPSESSASNPPKHSHLSVYKPPPSA